MDLLRTFFLGLLHGSRFAFLLHGFLNSLHACRKKGHGVPLVLFLVLFLVLLDCFTFTFLFLGLISLLLGATLLLRRCFHGCSCSAWILHHGLVYALEGGGMQAGIDAVEAPFECSSEFCKVDGLPLVNEGVGL